MPKRSEIQAQMDALAEQLAAADDDDDFEVWMKTDTGHEARMPSKKAGSWLKENFGIDLNPPAPGTGDQGDGDGEGQGDSGKSGSKPPAGNFFGKRKP